MCYIIIVLSDRSSVSYYDTGIPNYMKSCPQILRLEDDAGSDFRGRIRILERQLADAKVKVQGLEGQLVSSKKQAEEYKNMSQAYETQLTELNTTTEEFK